MFSSEIHIPVYNICPSNLVSPSLDRRNYSYIKPEKYTNLFIAFLSDSADVKFNAPNESFEFEIVTLGNAIYTRF